ncbi:hypothetical protein ZIOFF_001170 [Zingiber officinale]|uniref:DUF4149 domain-containing protein n=1 Tax=Zingiber officinale TaxID=94328 RepID=A0A8J5HUI2_ZINOF|nr:hypothetical protein ZIOFF_001170 [Zingiber officinale]
MAWSTHFLTAVAFLAVGILFAQDVFGSGPEAPAAAVTAAKTCHLFHRLGHLPVGHFYRRHHDVQVFAEAPVRQSSEQDVPRLLHDGFCVRGNFGGCVCISPSMVSVCVCLDQFCNKSCTSKLILPNVIAQMMKKRHNIERDLNIGDEVGASKNTEAAKISAQLKSMNKKFGMIHGLSSLANIMAFVSLAIHSLYLAGKLHF